MKKQKLVLIPGCGVTPLVWEHQKRHLSDIAECQTLLLTEYDSIDKMAEAALMQVEGKFTLAGHSLGGWVAMAMALKAPERVEKLILIATWPGNSSPEHKQLFKDCIKLVEMKQLEQLFHGALPMLLHPACLENQTIVGIMKQMQEDFPLEGMLCQLKAELEGKDLSALLNKITCPTLVVHARQDLLFPLVMQEALVAHLGHARLTIVEDSGHMLPIEQPQAVTALLRLWLGKIIA